MGIKLVNNATSRLSAPITPSDTSIPLESGGGNRFPSLGLGEWFPVTFANELGEVEIARCVARSGDILTVERAQEGTSAKAFQVGDRVDMRLTVGAINTLKGHIFQVGDFLDSVRTLGPEWIRRDGAVYDNSEYPSLAALIGGIEETLIEQPLTGTGSSITNWCVGEDDAIVGICQQSGNTVIVKSVDGGLSFQTLSIIEGFSAHLIGYGGGVYVAVAFNMYVSYSSDGISWSTPAQAPGSPHRNVDGIIFGDGAFFVTNSNAAGGSASTYKIYKSTNGGQSWSVARNGPSSSGMLRGHYANGTIVIVGFGTDGEAIVSDDLGATWSVHKVPSGGLSVIIDVVEWNGTWYALNRNGVVHASTNNGESWSVVSQPASSEGLSRRLVVNGDYIYLSDNGRLFVSEDAITWSTVETGVSTWQRIGLAIPGDAARTIWTGATSGRYLLATKVLQDQFRVPDDNPAHGWIRAAE